MVKDDLRHQGHFRSETFFQKLTQSKFFWVCALSLAFAFPIYRSVNRILPPPLPILSKLPEFKLTNEFNKSFGSQELSGRPYIASFFFTNCTTSCVKITTTMETIQKRIKGLGTAAALVSFTVDPQNDTPKVLSKFARSHNSNPYVWNFLTGNEKAIKDIVVGGFKLVMGEAAQDGAVDTLDIAHSEKLVLVDGYGRVRSYYSIEKADVDRLMIDLGLLINAPKEKKL